MMKSLVLGTLLGGKLLDLNRTGSREAREGFRLCHRVFQQPAKDSE